MRRRKQRDTGTDAERDKGQDMEGQLYEGFCYDLTQLVAESVGFNYSFRINKDEKYGIQLSNGSWNGMIGELIRKVYHLIACASRKQRLHGWGSEGHRPIFSNFIGVGEMGVFHPSTLSSNIRVGLKLRFKNIRSSYKIVDYLESHLGIFYSNSMTSTVVRKDKRRSEDVQSATAILLVR